MTELQTIFYTTFPYLELICAIVGISQFNKLKSTYWKWFVIYLFFIAFVEVFSIYGLNYFPKLRKYYYDFFVIPIEFIFFFWLYAKKSLQLNKLFWVSCMVYFIFYILHLFNLDSIRMISSMSYTVGVFILAILIY